MYQEYDYLCGKSFEYGHDFIIIIMFHLDLNYIRTKSYRMKY